MHLHDLWLILNHLSLLEVEVKLPYETLHVRILFSRMVGRLVSHSFLDEKEGYTSMLLSEQLFVKWRLLSRKFSGDWIEILKL